MAGQRLRAQDRRAQILSAAATLFEADGYHVTTLEQIALAVGIRKASLYYHFKSKDDLLVALHQEMMMLLIESQEQRSHDSSLTRTEMLRGIMHDIVGLMESHPGRMRIFFEAYRELPDAERSEISLQRREYRQTVSTVIQDGVAAGEFRECDPELASLAILGMCNWTYQWYRVDGQRRSGEIADYFLEFVMTGMRPD